MALWGGRFEGETDPLFKAINDSLSLDSRLVEEDIASSIAWAEALRSADVLSSDEAARIVAALKEIADVAQAAPDAVANAHDEDVHSWVEAQLIERIGELGKKLHTGRSRNDQVATDLRLWTRQAVSQRQAEIRRVQEALLRLAEREHDTMLPGYTHLQRAQPVLLAHWCLAYFEMLQRDQDRLTDASKRLELCPLGSGALAGTSYPIDRETLAKVLGFAGPTLNSMDAVSDRDFVVEVLSAVALCGVHLSRFAEDVIFYASGEAGLIELDDSMTSGSSLLPQKKNPDALELVRGKAGRLIGSLVSILVTLKGLPLAYNKDLQEDKAPLFDAMENLSQCLGVIPPILDRLRVDRAKAAAAADSGYANATDLADYLVVRGVPFRDAHEAVGHIVQHAIRRGLTLDELPLQEMTRFSSVIRSDVRAFICNRLCLSKRNVIGGTAPFQVVEAKWRAAARLNQSQAGTTVVLKQVGESGGAVVRQACLDDVDDIGRIVDYWAAQGENLPRSRSDIVATIQGFGVAYTGDKFVGCGSLHVYTSLLAEIRSLGVDPDAQGGGAGSNLVRYFIDRARELHIPKVFVLTRAQGFFERLGFRIESIELLPEKVWKDCASCPRQSCCDEVPMVYEVPV